MKVLHILTGGKPGGIETLCREIGRNSNHEHGFCFMSFGGEIYEQMDRLGLTTYPLFLCGKKWCLKKLLMLMKLARKYDILVIHHEDPFMESYYIITKLIIRKKGIRYIHSCYSDPLNKDTSTVKRLMNHITRQLSISMSDMVITVSVAGLDSASKEYRLNRGKCKVIYNGISNDYIKTGVEHHVFESETINILYAGRLASIKGVNMLIDALALLKETYVFHLSVLGDGKDRKRLEKQAAEKELNCTFYGSQTEMGEYYRKADIFIYPSIVQEVFGISIVEAMAYGIPCIANRVGGVPEIIKDGYNGFLTESVSAEGLYRTIERVIELCRDKDRLDTISERARITAKKFSIKNTCTELDKVFEEICKLSS